MRTTILNYSFLGLLAGLLIFSSCTKEDLVVPTDKVVEMEQVIEEEEEVVVTEEENTTPEEVKTEAVLRINGSSMNTDAYAGFCTAADGSSLLVISNKVELLNNVLTTEDFVTNDFLFFYSIDTQEIVNSYGGAAFEEDITGLPGRQIVFSDTEVIIDSNDGSVAVGSMDGAFQLYNPTNGELVDLPFSVTFAAEIITGYDYWCN